MSDITGDAFTIHAAETIEKAIEHVGKTASQQQVGKAIAIKNDGTGAVLANASDNATTFIGVVKAASGESQATFAASRMVNDAVTGANPTLAPYYQGDVTIPEGKAMTVERNCVTYVLMSENIKAGELIGCAADGKFKKVTAIADAVGRAYSANDANNVARVYIRAI